MNIRRIMKAGIVIFLSDVPPDALVDIADERMEDRLYGWRRCAPPVDHQVDGGIASENPAAVVGRRRRRQVAGKREQQAVQRCSLVMTPQIRVNRRSSATDSTMLSE